MNFDMTWLEATKEFRGCLVRINCGDEGYIEGEVDEVDPDERTIIIKSPFSNGRDLGMSIIKLGPQMIKDIEVLRMQNSANTHIQKLIKNMSLDKFIGSLITIQCGPSGIYQGKILELDIESVSVTLEQPFKDGKPTGKLKEVITKEMMCNLCEGDIRIISENRALNTLKSHLDNHPTMPTPLLSLTTTGVKPQRKNVISKSGSLSTSNSLDNTGKGKYIVKSAQPKGGSVSSSVSTGKPHSSFAIKSHQQVNQIKGQQIREKTENSGYKKGANKSDGPRQTASKTMYSQPKSKNQNQLIPASVLKNEHSNLVKNKTAAKSKSLGDTKAPAAKKLVTGIRINVSDLLAAKNSKSQSAPSTSSISLKESQNSQISKRNNGTNVLSKDNSSSQREEFSTDKRKEYVDLEKMFKSLELAGKNSIKNEVDK